MKNRNVFWGALLVAIGVLFILDNMDLINFSFSAFVSLWPLLLVAWGISILPVKSVYKTVASLALVLFALIYGTTSERSYWEDKVRDRIDHRIHYQNDQDDNDYESDEETYYTFQFDEEMDSKITNAKLSMDVAAGKFRMEGTSKDHIIDFEAYSNFGPYTSNMVTNGEHADINIGFDEAVIKGGNNRNRATVKLNPKVEWDLALNIGAADFRGDYRDFKINSIDIDGGASAINIKLGEKQEKTHIKLDAGAASIKIYIPESAGCKIITDSFLVDKQFDGFKKVESGEYLSNNYEESSQKIYIDLDAAISQLTVRRYQP